MTITPELLGKLTQRGPRYTSYPTAAQFHEGIGPMEVMASMHVDAEQGAKERPISLYFHVLYCKKLCWYCACHKEISRSSKTSAHYTMQLCDELDLRAPLLRGRKVTQIHFGGGTPTFLEPRDIQNLMRHVRMRFDVAPDAEIAIEIDPRACTSEHIDVLAKCGFNRASIGVQDVNVHVQRAINRVQPFDDTAACIEHLRQVGIDHINLDLIYGLPKQSLNTIEETIDQVLELSPDRLAVYGYAHVPWLHPAQKLLERHTLPDSSQRLDMLSALINTLESKGYVHIGMDHFAKPEDSLSRALEDGTLQRNFQGYSTQRGVDIQGVGPSAISATPYHYAQNHKQLADWRSDLRSATLPVMRGYLTTEEDRLRREIIMEIMCKRVVDLDAIATSYELESVHDAFPRALRELEQHEANGLIEIGAKALYITELGRHFLRNLAMCFDDASQRGQKTTLRYSATV